ncbi:MAG: tetratricopeptide repeat protein, partial [Alistipes sp.]|nr:tetratricopeptide repeat protein [Alistipes sp.]
MLLVLCIVTIDPAGAQNHKHRSHIREGNRAYASKNYERAAHEYKQALHHDSTLFEGIYNLGNASIKDKNYAKAVELLQKSAVDSTRTELERSRAYFNMGYAQFMQDSLQQALDCYRKALILNSTDDEARYNYVYVRTILENQK